MKIQYLKNIIEEMRTIYPFSDDDADIEIHDNIVNCEHYVNLHVKDEKTGIEIIMHEGI